ncbi:MAG: hypothetical protein D6694_01880 [Gammaproteobacteria bacterium]|nr:MAG: hypothetical protein D6694_01880 [Gammaproteobacteria bacterium]
MSDSTLKAIIHVARKIENEIREKESHLKLPVVRDIISHVVEVFLSPEFSGTWNKRVALQFYQNVGAADEDGRSKIPEKELFRINVGLDHVLRLIKKETDLRVSYWPEVRLANRQYLALEYAPDQIRQLREFQALLVTMVKRRPNIKIKQEELCCRIILSMIAFDGVLMANADGLICSIARDWVHLDCDMPVVELPISNKPQAQRKHYYIGEYTQACFKFLIHRGRKDGSLFPTDWRMTNRHHKKRRRRFFLECELAKLWTQTFRDRPVPENLDMSFWIQSSRLSCALGGVPFVGIAHLRNRLRGAQVPVGVVGSGERCQINSDNPYQWVRSMHKVIREQDRPDEKLRLKNIRNLSGQLKRSLDQASSNGRVGQNEYLLASWLIWMLEQDRFKEMRLSNYKGYVSAVANRVFPLEEGKLIKDLTKDEWVQMIKDLAEDVDYMPSSRRTAITHLKRFNEYLSEKHLAPRIDFNNYAFRVRREFAECSIVFPHEVDLLLEGTQTDDRWLAILLAFYCGLRCEEICYLRPDSFEGDNRLVVGRSKLPSSRRTLPHGLLIPDRHLERLRSIIENRRNQGATFLLDGDGQFPVPTKRLSKRIGRLLVGAGCRAQKMHALRHGFASWQLVRYFMLVDERFRTDARVGRFNLDLDGRHAWFQDDMLSDLAEVIGGVQWRIQYEMGGSCVGSATDMIMISKLLGHSNRFTTLENYTNSLGWVCRYYLQRREARILSMSNPRRS